MLNNFQQSIVLALVFTSIIGFILMKVRILILRVKSLETNSDASQKDTLETIQHIKLHLKKHEEILQNIEHERLAPLASNMRQLHDDQKELLVYASKLFADQTFGTNFTKNGTGK